MRDTVTLRHRDSMEQERVKIEELCGAAYERDLLGRHPERSRGTPWSNRLRFAAGFLGCDSG